MSPPPPQLQSSPSAAPATRTLRLGFAGLGWIGRHRMQALLESTVVEAATFYDPSPDALHAARELSPNALAAESFDDLLAHDLDGVVIATPSALHAPQAIAALRRGIAVFCQKPLARSADETRLVVDAARAADRLLAVDLSYRHARAFAAAIDLARSGALGDLFAIDLTFHNAYGPDKPWFRDLRLSGGGCLIDLGVHLIDLALLALPDDPITEARGQLFAGGKQVPDDGRTVEDFAIATLRTRSGAAIRIACSWNLSAGQEAVIAASIHGDRGGALVHNINGSFYDFEALHTQGTSGTVIASPPDAWGGRAAIAWANQLARSPTFDPSVSSLINTAEALDRIYAHPSTVQVGGEA